MPRYAALLRGVSPMNATMPDLKRAFEAAGFTEVTTVLSSGNLVFTARSASEASLARKAEAATAERLGHAFLTIVRRLDALRELLGSDPYRGFPLEPGAKRVVTFLREPPSSKIALPIGWRGAHVLAVRDKDAFSAYVRHPKGAAFMTLIERTFGKEQTTRTWETVAKIAKSASP
jgi:uncharacterized protein (DUF1697 family)